MLIFCGKKDMKNSRGRVAIISRESNEKTIDVELLERELRRRGVETLTLSRLLTKDRSARSLAYAGHVLKQEAAILRASVVVLDTYCIPASMLPHRKKTKVIQMWHALGAIKKFGWQTVGRPDGTSERVASLMKMHDGYDYVLSPSDVTAEHFCEAFRADMESIVKLGLPRIDHIKSVSAGSEREKTAKRIFERYPQLKDRKIVLYAPTFRRGKPVRVKDLTDAIDTDRYAVAVKLHPLYREGSRAVGKGVIADEEFSSYEWLSVADIIISDYSSFVIECTLADKPLYIYAYDMDEYDKTTGLNIDFRTEPIAPYVFSTAAGLADSMEKKYDMKALERFRDRYIDIDTGSAEDGGCTSRLADFIEEQLEEKPERSVRDALESFFKRVNPGP